MVPGAVQVRLLPVLHRRRTRCWHRRPPVTDVTASVCRWRFQPERIALCYAFIYSRRIYWAFFVLAFCLGPELRQWVGKENLPLRSEGSSVRTTQRKSFTINGDFYDKATDEKDIRGTPVWGGWVASWKECQAFVILRSSKHITTATFKDLKIDLLHKTPFGIYNQSVEFLP